LRKKTTGSGQSRAGRGFSGNQEQDAADFADFIALFWKDLESGDPGEYDLAREGGREGREGREEEKEGRRGK